METTIPGSLTVSYATVAFSNYKPLLEEMFQIELPDIDIKPIGLYPEDFRKAALEKMAEQFEPKGSGLLAGLGSRLKRGLVSGAMAVVTQAQVKTAAALYCALTNAIYMGQEGEYQSILEHEIVHEAGHACQDAITGTTETPTTLEDKIIAEGFANFVATDMFNEHYLPRQMQDSLKRIRKALYETGSSYSRLPSNQWEDTALCTGTLGYWFFREVTELGIDAADILRSPPSRLSLISNPESYVSYLKEHN